MLRHTRHTLPSLYAEELAIIAPVDTHGETIVEAQVYVQVSEITSRTLFLRAKRPVAPDELLDISLSLQGQDAALNLRGIARIVLACDTDSSYIVGVELPPDDQPADWRHQFH